jgi:hypothetical protein
VSLTRFLLNLFTYLIITTKPWRFHKFHTISRKKINLCKFNTMFCFTNGVNWASRFFVSLFFYSWLKLICDNSAKFDVKFFSLAFNNLSFSLSYCRKLRSMSINIDFIPLQGFLSPHSTYIQPTFNNILVEFQHFFFRSL